MRGRKVWRTVLAGVLILIGSPLLGAELTVDGGPTGIGFNSGSFAYIHATVHGSAAKTKRYVVFAEIQYYGTTANTSVEMDRLPETKPGVEEFQVGWPIPPQAPTGFYTLTLHVEDRIEHLPGVTKKVCGFVVYKKSVRISRVSLDKKIYNVGEPIKCEVGLENLSDTDVKGLRLEFSNGSYPWISLSSQGARDNPDVSVLREHVDIAAGTAVTIPMSAAGTAILAGGKQGERRGPGSAVGNEQIHSSELTTYAVSLWNADHTILYDMQFAAPTAVHRLESELPKPYSPNFTYPHNFSSDFKKYGGFDAPGLISPAISLDHSLTLLRPGDILLRKVIVENTTGVTWKEAHVEVSVTDSHGSYIGGSANLLPAQDYAPRKSRSASAVAWAVNEQEAPGVFSLKFSLLNSHGTPLATTTQQVNVNRMPASLLVVCAHEGDEKAFAGLICAAVEAKIPSRVLILTSGDVGGCEHHFGGSCGPSEAYESSMARMEKSAVGLVHLGIPRAKIDILCLPDEGLGDIWFHHKDATNPFLSVFLACDHAPFANAYRPNLPFARDAIIGAIRQIISDFRPAMIALPYPDEGYMDQDVANWFTLKACQGLLKVQGLDPHTVVLASPASAARGFRPAPYHYENYVVYLSGEAAALKEESTWIYESQDGNQAEGEIKTLAELPREERYLRITDWQEHEGWNEVAMN